MIAREQREVLRDIVGHGLTSGLGDPTPGSMCVEAAVCLAFGEPHGDRPTCVAGPDRSFAVGINDATWSSDAARAEALLPLALAQLGTAGTYRTAWVRRVADGTIRRVLPLALRAFAAESPHREALLAAADRCEQEGSAVAAVDAVRNVGADVIGTGSSCIYDALCAAGAAYDAHYAAAPRAAYAALAATAAARGVICRHGDADQVLRVAVDVALDAYRAERGAVDELWMDAEEGES